MKKIFLLLIILLPLMSCNDGLYDLYDDLTMKVPICVDSSVSTSGDGRGWANAFKTIQEAVDAAEDGDEVWVTSDTYTLTSPLNITKTVSIYGGFDGSESRRKERNSESKTIITQSGGFELIEFSSNCSGNIIESFDFLSGGTFALGYAVLVRGDVEFSNCIYSNGFSLLCDTNSIVIIKNCRFLNSNIVEMGGALYIKSNAVVTAINCDFISNKAELSGGAVLIYGGNFTADRCTFIENNTTDSSSNAGAISSQNGIVQLINSSFDANYSIRGGALALFNSTIEITGSDFLNNRSNNGYGGAIYLDATSKISINGCEFKSNYGKGGGAIWSESQTDSYNMISNSLFYNNTSDAFGNSGSAISLTEPLTLCNLTFYFNKNVNSSNPGGTIFMGGNTSLHYFFYNLVFYGNTDVSFPDDGAKKNISTTSNLNIYNSFYYDGISVTGTLNSPDCITSNSSSPFLNIDSSSPYFLRPNSLIINKGLNTIPGFTMPSTDLAGNPRIAGGIVDIGAYESQ